MKTLYIEPICGVAGDMLVAALLKLFPENKIDDLKKALSSMPISQKWDISLSDVERHAISAVLFNVEVEEEHAHSHHHHHHHGRTLPEIEKIIKSAKNLSEEVIDMACRVFKKLAEAEALVHGKEIEYVHFHEVGAVDAIIDIVSCCYLIEELDVDDIRSSPISLGRGTVNSAHGVLPVPVPATLNLLKGIPVNHTNIESELATPTGSALLSTVVSDWDSTPSGVNILSSYGAGTRDLKERAAVIRLSIYEDDNKSKSQFIEDEIAVLECNIDDMPGEHFSWLSPKVLDAGALDIALIPIQMKKNRPGIILQILCKVEDLQKFTELMLRETSTIGVRYRIEKRFILNREIRKIENPWGEAFIKHSYSSDKSIDKYKIEFESCAKLAKKHNLSYKEMESRIKSLLGK